MTGEDRPMPSHVVYHLRTRGTGPEGVHARGMIRALRALGHTVRLVAPPGVDPERTAGASPYGGEGRARSWRLLAQRAPAWAFDLAALVYNIYAWVNVRRALDATPRPRWVYERYAPFLLAGVLAARRRDTRVVLEVNESVSIENVRRYRLGWLARLIERLVFARADAVLVVTPQLRHRLVEIGVPPRRVHVIPNAVDADRFSVPAERVAAVVRRHGLAGADIRLVFVGWFVPWHGLPLLLQATARMVDEGLRAKALLVGDGPLRPELELLTADLGLTGAVHFTGAIPFGDVAAHLAACDVGVIPMTNDFGSPIKLFEYLAAGLAVVAPALPQITSIVRSEREALLVTPGDMDALAAALARLARDEPLRRRLGERGRALVLARHTWQRNAERAARIAERAARRRTAGA